MAIQTTQIGSVSSRSGARIESAISNKPGELVRHVVLPPLPGGGGDKKFLTQTFLECIWSRREFPRFSPIPPMHKGTGDPLPRIGRITLPGRLLLGGTFYRWAWEGVVFDPRAQY